MRPWTRPRSATSTRTRPRRPSAMQRRRVCSSSRSAKSTRVARRSLRRKARPGTPSAPRARSHRAADDQLRGSRSGVRSRLRAERGTRGSRARGRGIEFVRFRRAQRDDRDQALRRVTRWATFDCYGTLIDWNAGIRAELARVFGEDRAGAQLRRYHELEPELEADGTLRYREVMTEAMRRLGAPAGEESGLAQSLPGWQAFPEVRTSLEEVRRRGWRLAILSNTDPDFIAASKE